MALNAGRMPPSPFPLPPGMFTGATRHFEIYNGKKYEECLAVRDVTSRARKKSKVREEKKRSVCICVGGEDEEEEREDDTEEHTRLKCVRGARDYTSFGARNFYFRCSLTRGSLIHKLTSSRKHRGEKRVERPRDCPAGRGGREESKTRFSS